MVSLNTLSLDLMVLYTKINIAKNKSRSHEDKTDS